jgi:hypothetical protein
VAGDPLCDQREPGSGIKVLSVLKQAIASQIPGTCGARASTWQRPGNSASTSRSYKTQVFAPLMMDA